MKYLIYIFILIFFSCSQPSVEHKENSDQKPITGTIEKLCGRWLEEDDTLHIIEFAPTEMIEEYNGSIIKKYAVTLFNGMPGDGGYEDPAGRIIQIEESKDNFHHYSIVLLDSGYLELLHKSSGKTRFYKRL